MTTLPMLDNPPRKANGTIDHTGCPHDATPAGRRACREHVARVEARSTPEGRAAFHQRTVAAVQAVAERTARAGGTRNTKPRGRRVPRASEPIGRWVTARPFTVDPGTWVRVHAPASTGRQLWIGELIVWNNIYCSVYTVPGFTRHLRHSRGEVIRVEVFESDAPEWNGPGIGDTDQDKD